MNKAVSYLILALISIVITSCDTDNDMDTFPIERQLSKMTIEESIDLGITYPQKTDCFFENGLRITDSIYFNNALSFTTIYEYNSGNLIAQRFFDPNSNLMEEYQYNYDALQRIESTSYEDFVFPFNSSNSYTYGSNNTVSINNGSFTLNYNSDNLVTMESDQGGRTDTAIYNGLLPVDTNFSSDNVTFTYTYDSNSYRGGYDPTSLFNYNLLNTYIFSDGLRSNGATLGVNAANRLSTLQKTYNNTNDVETLNFNYSLDQEGYLIQVTESSSLWNERELRRTTFEY
jgi:hypothetical protein